MIAQSRNRIDRKKRSPLLFKMVKLAHKFYAYWYHFLSVISNFSLIIVWASRPALGRGREVQCQPKPDFYWELLAEINIYLNQFKPVQDWKAVALFADRRFEVKNLTPYQQELVNSDRIIRIYLDELPTGSIGVGLIQLIVAQESQAPILVQELLQRAKTEIADAWVTRDIIDLLETVLVSKFAQLSRQEIQAMFLLTDIKQTRVYQEARQEGRQVEASLMLKRLLSKRFGKLNDRRLEAINNLSLEQLEDLGEALLDFTDIAELDTWLITKGIAL